jgi:hypothetical protein
LPPLGAEVLFGEKGRTEGTKKEKKIYEKKRNSA